MGSLMAGWDSPPLDPDTIRSMRNRSFTKEDIEKHRKLHNAASRVEQESEQMKREAKKQCSSTKSPQCEKKLYSVHSIDCPEKLKKTETGDWWTKSNWAFLNELPKD
ncbi:hypothetical protein AMTRI_Chr02g224380 [Amborella trichopoda]|uniref:uncharacterized protein LOC110006907 n=1 Tax=Amborella trichopoda TaxID=13333 RepID=UPI0009BEDF38|nr:uncharacterized protein LOC110006907 [Amborella trichopoda]|eukprot:XP_020520592.1 uncharacterized protein LOC110006907 [Amborella trichopoda]